MAAQRRTGRCRPGVDGQHIDAQVLAPDTADEDGMVTPDRVFYK